MTPDPAFLYLGETHREGLATLVYGVRNRKGFVLLTGEVGTGKTTLLHALLGQLDTTTASAFIFNPKLEIRSTSSVVLFDEFGIERELPDQGRVPAGAQSFPDRAPEAATRRPCSSSTRPRTCRRRCSRRCGMLSNLETSDVEAAPDHAGRPARAERACWTGPSCGSCGSGSFCATT